MCQMTTSIYLNVTFPVLKLVRTNLICRVLGTSTAAICFSNDHYLYAPITTDECHA